MPRDELILASHSLPAATFRQRCKAAEEGGFSGIGLTVAAYHAARDEMGSDGALRARLATGRLRIAEFGSVRIGGPRDRARLAEEIALRVHLAATFGIDRFSTIIDAGEDPEWQEAAFVGLCGALAGAGARVGIEFIPMLSALPDLPSALRFIDEASVPDAGVVLDSFHFFSGGSGCATLHAVDASMITAVQLSDGRRPPIAADYRTETMRNRLPPGEGDFALAAFIAALDAIGVDLPWSIEVLSDALAELYPREIARRLGTTARAFLKAGARGAMPSP